VCFVRYEAQLHSLYTYSRLSKRNYTGYYYVSHDLVNVLVRLTIFYSREIIDAVQYPSFPLLLTRSSPSTSHHPPVYHKAILGISSKLMTAYSTLLLFTRLQLRCTLIIWTIRRQLWVSSRNLHHLRQVWSLDAWSLWLTNTKPVPPPNSPSGHKWTIAREIAFRFSKGVGAGSPRRIGNPLNLPTCGMVAY
jgi:hypothetical protein